MMEYDHEPIRGLPGPLPEGEHIVWQGAPDWRTFARSALYTRWIGVYFMILTLAAIASGSIGGAIATTLSGFVAVGLLWGFAALVGKTTVYTITNKRVVLRIGVALNKCINLPLRLIGSADLRPHAGGHGDIALSLTGAHRLGYAALWPHARPFRFAKVQPMLRSIPDAERTARVLAEACAAHVPNSPVETEAKAATAPAPGLQEAAA